MSYDLFFYKLGLYIFLYFFFYQGEGGCGQNIYPCHPLKSIPYLDIPCWRMMELVAGSSSFLVSSSTIKPPPR